MAVKTVAFDPFSTQRPGTGGLRRPTREFIQPHYAQGFIQAAIDQIKDGGGRIDTWVIGSDGRFPGREMLPSIVKILIANGAKKIIAANADFVSTTPAVSNLIIKHRADGGFMLSASHNPGGIDGDFGIKIETSRGGQPGDGFNAPLALRAASNGRYLAEDIGDGEALERVEFADAVEEYFDLMRSIFDFDAIRGWFGAGNSFAFDCMNASAGAFAKRIFCDAFGAPGSAILRPEPMPDFGGIHPEPNITYNRGFYDFMMGGGADFGVAVDGDGDRNMVLGRGIFIAPPDALAVFVKHHGLVPYYRGRLKGVARSMPTSSAADAVAARLGISLYATPTGWKWFGPLLESGMVQLCGEESFGQGGDYIGEKDAIFAALYWLNILGATGMTPGQVMRGLWDEYGRMFYSQYSYEGVDADAAARIVGRMRGADLAGRNGIASLENIFYSDPATGEKSGWEGTQIKTDDGARIFFRLSGTGTSGATMRFYIEKPERDPAKFGMDNREYLSGLSARAVEIFGIREAFGEEPKKTVAI